MYMSEIAVVRYYFLWGPKREQRGRWWPTLGYKYLVALRRGFCVRAVPIGWAHFQLLDHPKWKHWKKVYDSFGCQLVERPVNIVCCPGGIVMGRTMRVSDLAPKLMDGVPAFLTEREGDGEEVVYEPGLALSVCFTDGLRNIAITGTRPTTPNETELATLKRYDAVVTPTEDEAAFLSEAGVRAQCYTPRQLANDALALGFLLNGRGDE